ncbi:hypothetical protein DL89DRAFT_79593 [Linderina pennispora]|uniref:Uncharacterized protein n=1 Tax=Linderina pennispora TaxID=61395 RepID=A0A1Y1VR42_9FUNG|nr:uncharacterized protein DL89DRAFT_79593 [Linderina pennispora]ORX63496.1 hypothetical protein DL89DRAFT_79593 [Linderina pennispora]
MHKQAPAGPRTPGVSAVNGATTGSASYASMCTDDASEPASLALSASSLSSTSAHQKRLSAERHCCAGWPTLLELTVREPRQHCP